MTHTILHKIMKNCIGLICLLGLQAGLLAPSAYAHPKIIKTINLHTAVEMAEASRAKAKELGADISIAILDNAGHLVLFYRMNGANYPTIDFATQKARTSIIIKKPSKAAQDRLAQGHMGILAIKDILPMQGGLPILIDGELWGAIGVSGARTDIDELCAQAGIDVLIAEAAKAKLK